MFGTILLKAPVFQSTGKAISTQWYPTLVFPADDPKWTKPSGYLISSRWGRVPMSHSHSALHRSRIPAEDEIQNHAHDWQQQN